MGRSSLSITGTERFGLAGLIAGLLVPACLQAGPRIEVVEKTYGVDATTSSGLVDQMHARGPRGYWAYTSWYVEWTGDCQVTAKIVFTMPEHRNAEALDTGLRDGWTAMIAALRAHEEQHAAHGRKAANEIARDHCRNGHAIIDKWAREDVLLDARSNHGMKEGVVLP